MKKVFDRIDSAAFRGAMKEAMQKRSKYNAKRVEIDGIWFHSEMEGKRYQELKLLVRAGEITNLTLQPKYEFRIDGELMFVYIADFRYDDKVAGEIIEDVKGVRTPEYKLKKKLIEKKHGIRITEV